jgi:hypothetical protein
MRDMSEAAVRRIKQRGPRDGVRRRRASSRPLGVSLGGVYFHERRPQADVH